MLEDETIVAVAAQGRVSENLEFARAALERGKHVWLDKPAGDDLEAFRAVLDIAREKGLCIQLGYMFRYNAGFQFLACHLIDIVVAILGRPERAEFFSQNLDHVVPWYRDNTTSVFEYADALVTIESTASEVSTKESRRFEVYGTRGSVIIEPLEPPALRLCLDEDRDGYAKGWQSVDVENRPRYVESLRALVADIRGEKSPDRSLDHEFTVQETVLRAVGLL